MCNDKYPALLSPPLIQDRNFYPPVTTNFAHRPKTNVSHRLPLRKQFQSIVPKGCQVPSIPNSFHRYDPAAKRRNERVDMFRLLSQRPCSIANGGRDSVRSQRLSEQRGCSPYAPRGAWFSGNVTFDTFRKMIAPRRRSSMAEHEGDRINDGGREEGKKQRDRGRSLRRDREIKRTRNWNAAWRCLD